MPSLPLRLNPLVHAIQTRLGRRVLAAVGGLTALGFATLVLSSQDAAKADATKAVAAESKAARTAGVSVSLVAPVSTPFARAIPATGTVAPAGLGFVQLSGTNDSPAGRTDGSLALGMGFGSAEDGLGVQVTAQVTSLTDSFGDSGYLGLKLSRRLGAAHEAQEPAPFSSSGQDVPACWNACGPFPRASGGRWVGRPGRGQRALRRTATLAMG